MDSVDLGYGDLVERFGPNLVRQVFCDNGSGTPGPRLFRSLKSGRRIADSVLLAAWSQEQIETLVAEDDAVRGSALDLVLSEGMAGKLEWDVEGGARDRLRKAALENLRMLVKGEQRSTAEKTAGANPHIRAGRVNTQRTPHTFIFAPSRAKPRPGGF